MLTMKEHILTLPEPYRSEALKAIANRGNAVNEKFRTLKNALIWALPAFTLKDDPFWAGVFDSENKATPKPERKRNNKTGTLKKTAQ